ncbi:MAG: type II secretion system F family protein [Candidatus Micrarchaeota archaeon]|nr:type II secretion system F family protein [Candidatus Micrarchaeota archaeon]
MYKIKYAPLLFTEYKKMKNILKYFYPLANVTMYLPLFSNAVSNLKKIKADIHPRDYIAGVWLTFIFYTFFAFVFMFLISLRREELFELDYLLTMLSISVIFGNLVMIYVLLIPRWISNKLKREMEKNLFFATRHIMIHTSAGVPLYDVLVSISHEYEDETFNYGEFSTEFAEIVKKVRGGMDLSDALEESARKSDSPYYRRLAWQLANANKSGTNIGKLLRHQIDYISKEQETQLKNYGAQLNPLAMFYMMVCIVAPTMLTVLVAVISTLITIPLGQNFFILIFILSTIAQFFFFGLFKSKRPGVAI